MNHSEYLSSPPTLHDPPLGSLVSVAGVPPVEVGSRPASFGSTGSGLAGFAVGPEVGAASAVKVFGTGGAGGRSLSFGIHRRIEGWLTAFPACGAPFRYSLYRSKA